MEGAEIADPTGGFFQAHMVPSFEAISEVKVNVSNIDAERQLTAVTDVTTKSGGMEAERRFYQGLGFRASYTWSKNITDVQDIFSDRGRNMIENPFSRERDRGNNEFTARYRFVANVIWELPAGKGKRWLQEAGAATHILGGWQVTAIAVAQTGLFFRTVSVTLIFPKTSGPSPAGSTLLPWPFPPTAALGTVAWGSLEGPGLASFSMGVHKNIALAESKTFRFEATFSNFFKSSKLSESCRRHHVRRRGHGFRHQRYR